jgi:phosphoribosylanthranilate isomerase
VKVKICGLTRQEDVIASAEAGADAVGFVVGAPSSPRNLSLERAERLLRAKPSAVEGVLVTVANDASELVEACQRLRVSSVQLHGNKSIDVSLLRNKVPNLALMRGVNANSANAFDEALAASRTYDAVVVDSYVGDQLGGTGLVHDWELSKRVRAAIHPKMMVLAGGLTCENVVGAVQKVQPGGVDVSSGVELQPGIKSHEKIFRFVENAKSVEL